MALGWIGGVTRQVVCRASEYYSLQVDMELPGQIFMLTGPRRYAERWKSQTHLFWFQLRTKYIGIVQVRAGIINLSVEPRSINSEKLCLYIYVFTEFLRGTIAEA